MHASDSRRLSCAPKHHAFKPTDTLTSLVFVSQSDRRTGRNASGIRARPLRGKEESSAGAHAITVPVGRTVAREGPCLMAGVFGHLACAGDAGLTCLNARRRSATQFWRWTHASHATPAALRNDLYARVCGLPDATPHCARIGRSHLLAQVPWCDAGVEATHGRCRAGLAFLRGGARCVRMAGRVRRTGRKCWCR